MKEYTGLEVQLHSFLVSVLHDQPYILGRFISRESAPNSDWTRGWVDPRGGMDTLKAR